MLPSNELFSNEMKKMDARKSDIFVVYDKSGNLSAPRAYWMLKTFGAQNVKILEGTYSRWEKEGYEIESGEDELAFKRVRGTEPLPDDYDFKIDKNRYLLFDEILKIQHENEKKPENEQVPILDSRFTKIYDEGHIPTSKTFPFTEVLNPDRSFKNRDEIIKVFKS